MPIPQPGLRLIRSHQLHGGIGHSIGCGDQHGIGRVNVSTGDAVGLLAEQRCDRRLVVPEVGCETGKRMAQHELAEEIKQCRDNGYTVSDTRQWRSGQHGRLHRSGKCGRRIAVYRWQGLSELRAVGW